MTDLEPAGPGPAAGEPIPVATSLRAALDAALADVPHLPRDRALVALARRYADMLDDCGDRLDEAATALADTDGDDGARDFNRWVTTVTRLGPRLEAVLDKLGMSPAARRGDGSPNVPDDPAAGRLRDLRAAATARIDHGPAVDPAVTAALAGE